MSSRRVRRVDVTKKKTGYTSQRDIDGTSHRLSRVPDKYNANRSVASEKNEPYCVSYFKNNPDSMDLRTPSEKLQELFDKLDEDLEPSVKFTTLIQIKSTQYMLHGENSVECLRAHAALGYFYNENMRAESALRHLEQAHNLERTNTIDQEESIRIAVETAQAHISLKNEKKGAAGKHISQAEDAARPYYSADVKDIHLRFKRDVVHARILSAKRKYDEALSQYEVALATLKEEKEGEAEDENEGPPSNPTTNSLDGTETAEEARLYVEMAEVAERQKGARRKAAAYYKRAYDIFVSLGMEESAKSIENKLPDEDEFEEEEEEEEEENQNEGDDGENNHEEETQEFAPRPPSDESRGHSRASRTSQNIVVGNEEEERETNFQVKEPPPRETDANESQRDGHEEEEEEGHLEEEEKGEMEQQNDSIVGGLLGENKEKNGEEEEEGENNDENGNEADTGNKGEEDEKEKERKASEEEEEGEAGKVEKAIDEEERKEEAGTLEGQQGEIANGLLG